MREAKFSKRTDVVDYLKKKKVPVGTTGGDDFLFSSLFLLKSTFFLLLLKISAGKHIEIFGIYLYRLRYFFLK